MPVNRGDIVLAELPFSDGSGSKVRPALVVQCDDNNQRLDDVIVAVITKTTKNITEPTQLLIAVTSPTGKQSGLLIDSAISCENLYTVRQDTIICKIGNLPPDAMLQVKDCLKAALEIP